MKFGHRFIVEPRGFELTADERLVLRELQPSGLMLRRPNFRDNDWLPTYRELIREVRSIIGENCIVSIDHEGGRVVRFPEPVTRFPYPSAYASDLALTSEVAKATGVELRSLGINLVFAPVADINSSPDNPVIGERAFGADAAQVSEAVVVFASALTLEGVYTCAKHFPGHGDTNVDSHFAMPVLNYSFTELIAREFLPFKALIDWGVPAVMTAHLFLPKLDAVEPATLSRKIIYDCLRTELGFSGLVISDALSMGALKSQLQAGDFALRAERAGVDLLLYVGPGLSIDGALELALEFERSGVDGVESKARIEAFRGGLPSHPVNGLEEETLRAHRELALRAQSGGATKEYIPADF